MKQMSDIKNFITENKLNFSEGSRNSNCTVLIGYSQFKGLTKQQLKEEIAVEIVRDGFIGEEIDRLFDYCKKNNYSKYWKTAEAKLQYTF